MITPDNLAPTLTALLTLAWPLVVLVFVILCRNQIRGLLERLEKAKLPGGTEASFRYGEASIDTLPQQLYPGAETEPVTKAQQPTGDSIKWSNSGNLFWVGYDLMWTIDMLLRGAPRERIVRGLRHFLHHVRSLGFTNPPIESKLAKLKADAENTLQKDWTPSLRDYYARELGSIGHHIGKLAEKNQSDYEPNPKE